MSRPGTSTPSSKHGRQTTRDHGVLIRRKLIAWVFLYSLDGLLADERTEDSTPRGLWVAMLNADVSLILLVKRLLSNMSSNKMAGMELGDPDTAERGERSPLD